jgi:hypothetical protein
VQLLGLPFSIRDLSRPLMRFFEKGLREAAGNDRSEDCRCAGRSLHLSRRCHVRDPSRDRLDGTPRRVIAPSDHRSLNCCVRRYTLSRSELESVKRELAADTGGASYLWQPRYNIAPTDQVPILVRDENGSRTLVPLVWGTPRERNGRTVRQINARAESVSPRIERCAGVGDRGRSHTPGGRRLPIFSAPNKPQVN